MPEADAIGEERVMQTVHTDQAAEVVPETHLFMTIT